MAPLVSVILPVFNRPKMVQEAVKSVIEQTHQSIELILVDDGSSDTTPEVLEGLQACYPGIIRCFHQDNAGPGIARNAGLGIALGEYIQYLDSDDLLLPEKLAKQVEMLEKHPDAGVCYCVTLRNDPDSNALVPWARTDQKIEDIFPSFLPKRGWATLTPLWRRSVCEQIGPWADFRIMEDWHHDVRAGMSGVKPVWVNEPLCVVRDHDDARASGMNSGFTIPVTRDFFRAHEAVWVLMKDRGLTDWSYVQAFSRTMFWIARMCGERGLLEEAEKALKYTDEMTSVNKQAKTTRMFWLLKSVLGWKNSARIAEMLHKLR